MNWLKPLALGLLLLAGCAGEPYRLELPANHPANAAAPEAPPPPASTTLSAGPLEPVYEKTAPAAGGHAGHAGMHH